MLRLLRALGERLARVPRAAAAALALGWAGFIGWLSSGPPPEAPLGWRFAYVFNLAHAPLYGVLALLLALALPRRGAAEGPPGWPALTPGGAGLVLALALAYGVVDERHQLSTPGRVAGWQDVLTDACGAAATLAVAAYVGRADAGPRGLWLRLALGAAACGASAWIATGA